MFDKGVVIDGTEYWIAWKSISFYKIWITESIKVHN